jgi:hypothetical protein
LVHSDAMKQKCVKRDEQDFGLTYENGPSPNGLAVLVFSCLQVRCCDEYAVTRF